MSNVFNVKKFHFNIPDVIANQDLEPLAVEKNFTQNKMLKFWENNRNFFHERLYWDKEKIDHWKIEKLSSLVDWAFKTCPYYQEKYRAIGFKPGDIQSLADFSKLPTLSKDEVIENFPIGLPSKKFDIHRCRWMSSSGSSGKQVQIVLPQARANLDILFKYRMFEFAGQFSLDPEKWLYNIHYCIWWHTSFCGRYPVFSIKQDCPPESVLAHIKQLRPQVISSIGSYLESLAQLGVNLKQFDVNIINSNSETTTTLERDRWEKIFQVPVRDEYSSEEIDILAMQCPAKSYHLVEDDVHVEIIDPDSTGLGDVVGTDLWNFAMPMIRYRQGDVAILDHKESKCSCGSHFRRLKHFHGRADEVLENKYGEKIAPGMILDAVENYLCAEEAGIKEFRVIQESVEQLKVLYVPKESQETDDRNHLFAEFSNKINTLFKHSIELIATQVNTLPDHHSFKRKTIINNIGRGVS